MKFEDILNLENFNFIYINILIKNETYFKIKLTILLLTTILRPNQYAD